MCRFYKICVFVGFELISVKSISNPTKTPTRVEFYETQIRYYINQSDNVSFL